MYIKIIKITTKNNLLENNSFYMSASCGFLQNKKNHYPTIIIKLKR